MTALKTNRVNHAYLFSGPRGCGKTTSARILARCLNCAEGPTDTPCGSCPSCIELSREGGGSLDVVEIDAASHNGVDDARELRERAVFAPARDRYKIFILDEAHMVTPQGFNALLKLVEEPPEHVKFIFATTEPEKVIGTIRSRTHHYPFRLIPPTQMHEYCEALCESENVTVEPGVLSLVVRAGGGSARDTLSLLDQLIAGSENNTVSYERAVALLGYTHSALLDEIIDALAAVDSAAAFGAVDRVIQTGQDPRRFVEDLLERLRDLIVVAATASSAASAFRGLPPGELERMQEQAHKFGQARLSQAADIVNSSLTEMTGATSPRLHLELMIARLLVRVGGAGLDSVPQETVRMPVSDVPQQETKKPSSDTPRTAAPAEKKKAKTAQPVVPQGPITTEILQASWPEILGDIQEKSRAAWLVVSTAYARSLEDDVLTLVFNNESDAASFRPQPGVPGGVHEVLRAAIMERLGVRVAFKVSSENTTTAPIEKIEASKEKTTSSPEPEFATPAAEKTSESTERDDGWDVVEIPGAKHTITEEPTAGETVTETQPVDDGRYGVAVVREILVAKFIAEEVTGPVPTVVEDE